MWSDESGDGAGFREARFGIPQITEVGVGLDRKVANLLKLISVEPPEALAGPAE